MPYPLPSSDPLGTDLQLDVNGDLVSSISGSIATANQAVNVSQAIRTRIMTVPSTYFWAQNFGTELSQYVDEPITPSLSKRITSIVKEKVAEDTRVLEVMDVFIDSSNTNMLIVTIKALISSVGVVEVPVVIGGV